MENAEIVRLIKDMMKLAKCAFAKMELSKKMMEAV